MFSTQYPFGMNAESTFSTYYSGFWGGGIFRWLDHAKLRVLRQILSGTGRGERVLDLGCGTGAIAARVKKAFPGIDISCADNDPVMVKIVSGMGFKVHQADLDKRLPFDDGYFRVVVMVDAIEHVESRKQTILEVKRILTKDGTAVIFTPPYDTITWLLGERIHHILAGREAGHISPFTRESLSKLLQRHFRRSEVKYLNFGFTLCGLAHEPLGD
jgi:ubiquinone/menaquinone biosynthesis C-methylase UbiE